MDLCCKALNVKYQYKDVVIYIMWNWKMFLPSVYMYIGLNIIYLWLVFTNNPIFNFIAVNIIDPFKIKLSSLQDYQKGCNLTFL